MKLQVNTKGSWRDVLSFEVERAPEVEDAAAMLARASGHQAFRVIDPDGTARHLNGTGVFRALRDKEE